MGGEGRGAVEVLRPVGIYRAIFRARYSMMVAVTGMTSVVTCPAKESIVRIFNSNSLVVLSVLNKNCV